MSISSLHIEIDKVDQSCWDHLITQFDDASLHQTWAYGISSGRRISHIAIKEGSNFRGCCQVILRKLPFFNINIADIKWGPLFMKKGEMFKPEILLRLVRAIKEEYGIKRGCLIKIVPQAIGERKKPLKQILEDECFKRNKAERPYKTFMLDLSLPLEELRNNLSQRWRRCLNKAERSELEVVEGTGDEFYKIFLNLAIEMVERKNLTKVHIDSFREYRRIQEYLPEPFKMKIMICKKDSEPVCATICSAIGDTGVYLFAATGQKGLKLNGSYILQWRMIQWMKGSGVRYYDLGAFNPQLNPGVYIFKLGIAGKRGWEEIFLGEYFGCFNLSSRFAKLLLKCSRFLKDLRTSKLRLSALKALLIQNLPQIKSAY